MKKSIVIVSAVAFILMHTGVSLSFDNPVNIHGFIAQSYMKTNTNNFIANSEDGTFQCNEMGINFTHEPVDKLRLGMQFFAYDFGSVGNDSILLDWAYADYRFYDYFGIRGGKIKNSVGLYQEVRDLDMLRTCILLPTGIYEELLRNTANTTQGIGIYGDINTSGFGSISYQATTGTGNVPKEGSGEALYLGIGMFDIEDVELDTLYIYNMAWSDPTGMVRLSQTAYFQELTADGTMLSAPSISVRFEMENIEIYLSSIEITWGNLVFAYERYYTKNGMRMYIAGADQYGLLKQKQLGSYWQASYRINNIFSIGYYYTDYYINERDRNGNGTSLESQLFFGDDPAKAWHKASAVSFRADISSNWIAKFEYHYVDGKARLQAPLNEDGMDRYWHMFIAKLSYNF